MSKRKSQVILTLFIMFVLLISSFSLAAETQNTTNNVNTNNVNATATEGQTEQTDEQNVTQNANQKTQNSDAFISGDAIKIDYLIDGNAFIAGNNVTISSGSQIGGDVFIMADTVTLEENAFIYNNAFILANNIIINGTVYDLYAFSSNITIGENGIVYRDMRSYCENLTISGAVGRNAYASCNQMNFSQSSTQEGNTTTSNGIIYGNLHYTSENEQNIPEGSVEGEVKYTAQSLINADTIQRYVVSLIMAISLAIVIWLLLMWLAPKFKENSKELLATKLIPSLGFGIISLFAIPIITLILLILQVTASAAMLILAIYIILLIIGANIFAITLSSFLASKFKSKNKVIEFIILIIVTVIIWAFRLIPYVGGVLGFICTVFGLGLLTKSVLPKKENKEEENNKETK